MLQRALVIHLFIMFLSLNSVFGGQSYIEYRVSASKKPRTALKSDKIKFETIISLLDKDKFQRLNNNYLLGDNKKSFYKMGHQSPFLTEIDNEIEQLKSSYDIITQSTNTNLKQCQDYKKSFSKLINSAIESSTKIIESNSSLERTRELIRLKLLAITYSSFEELYDLSFDFYDWGNSCFRNIPENDLIPSTLASLQRLNHYYLGVNGPWDAFPLATSIGQFAKKDLEEAIDELIITTPLVIAGVSLIELYFIPQVSAFMTTSGISQAARSFLSIAGQVGSYTLGAYYLYDGFKPLVESYMKMNNLEHVKQVYKNVEMVTEQFPEDNYNLYKLIYKIEENEHIGLVRNTPKKLKEKLLPQLIKEYGSEERALKTINKKLAFLLNWSF